MRDIIETSVVLEAANARPACADDVQEERLILSL